MTEAEWLGCTDPQRMLEFLRGKVSDRKLRLASVAWARSFLHHIPESRRAEQYISWLTRPEWHKQLDAAELYADGLIDRKALRAARQETGGPYNLYFIIAGISHFSFDAVIRSLGFVKQEFGIPPDQVACNIFRDIFSNLFRSTSGVPPWLAWNDATIPKIAQSIYDERAFDRMPILADALEDAGCDNADILNHCREPGEHVRGCWVVDLLLGKE